MTQAEILAEIQTLRNERDNLKQQIDKDIAKGYVNIVFLEKPRLTSLESQIKQLENRLEGK